MIRELLKRRGTAGELGSTCLLAAVLLLTVPLVGCAGDGGTGAGGASGDSMTAEERLDAADAEAEEWADNPTHLGVATGEWKASPPQNMEEAPLDWEQDDEFGDGHVPLWSYVYENEAGESLLVFVRADGETATEEQEDSDFQQEVGDWQISSSEAAETAWEDEDMEAILQADDAVITYMLQGTDGGPDWWIIAQSESMGEEQIYMVDAETGDGAPLGS